MKKASIHIFAVLLFLPLFTGSSFAARTQAPKVTTNAATSITINSATVNGGVNPNGLATTSWFEWGTDPTLATFGATPGQSISSSKGSKAIFATLSGLTSGTTYYFRVVASNSAGTSKGSIASFSTPAAAVAPTVVTNAASSPTTTGGVLNGGVNPNGLATNGWFEWGTSPTLAIFSSTSSQSLGSGTTSQGVATTLSGLTSGTTYYFRVAASNSAGTSKGSIASFSTTAAAVAPTVTTDAATSITVNSATVNGGVNPNGLATTAWFEWGTDSTLATFSSTSIQSLGSGTSSQPVNAALSGLSAGTPYYFRVAAFNSMGTSKGAIVGFSAASGAASGAFLQDGTGLVSMEAEHYQGNVPRGDYAWALVANPGYSGSGAVQAYPRDEALEPVVAGTGPQMDYQVQFSRTGTHYIWIRALAYSDSTDSAYVGLDGDAAGAAPVTGLNYDGQTWKWTKQTQVGPIAQIYVTSPGLHTINVWMRESGIVLDKLVLTPSSSYTPTGTGPPETVDVEYVAVGDSITFGSNDTISSDGIGYEPILGNLLTVSKGYPVNIANEGVGGVSSADGAAFISATLSKYPSAKYYLVMYGTNDADTSGGPTPSGMNSLPGDPGYDGSYKDNMQKIISAILANGKTPYLAEVPYTTLARYSNSSIQEYNVVIDQLYVANGISVTPPPFYAYFLAHPGELDDGLHPNGAGYQSMANMWFGALTK